MRQTVLAPQSKLCCQPCCAVLLLTLFVSGTIFNFCRSEEPTTTSCVSKHESLNPFNFQVLDNEPVLEVFISSTTGFEQTEHAEMFRCRLNANNERATKTTTIWTSSKPSIWLKTVVFKFNRTSDRRAHTERHRKPMRFDQTIKFERTLSGLTCLGNHQMRTHKNTQHDEAS